VLTPPASLVRLAEAEPANPWFSWDYVRSNWGDIEAALSQHVWLTLEALLLSVILALPLAVLSRGWPRLAGPVLGTSAVLYTIPSLALFVVLPGLLGTKILDPINVVIALTLYTLALMVRVVADALDSVSPLVRQSAVAMGYRPLRSLVSIQLPLAIPVIGAGLRVAAVSNVSLVSVAALLGIPQLGQLFTTGFQLNFYTPIFAGIVLCLLVAAVFDVLIQLAVRFSTPWERAVKAR